jgi:hypothetical protein
MRAADMTDTEALREAVEHVPGIVRAALEDKGFVPTADAGNLWFYDRGAVRLLFGEDGSDYPASLNDAVTVCAGPDDMTGTDYPTLRAYLYGGAE